VSERCDALVVGGGLLGCALAWHLARQGADVVLIEQDEVNRHASGQNAGSLHFQLEHRMLEDGVEAARRAAEAIPLHLDAADLWAGLADELGEDVGVRQDGGLMVAEDARQLRLLEQKLEIERSWGLPVEIVAGTELRRLAPYLSEQIVAAAHCPLEGKADARLAAPAFARAAAALGVQIRTGTRLVGLERAGAGWSGRCAASGGGQPVAVAADTVVAAAGIWTAEVARMVGVELPVAPVALTMTATAPVPPFVRHLVQHVGRRLSLKQVAAGNLLLGGGWAAQLPLAPDGRVELHARPTVRRDTLAANADTARRVVPAAADLPVVRVWTGMTTLLPDQLPLIGPLPGRPGIFVATGGAAFTLGPTVARLLAEAIGGSEPSLDIAPYAPDRFGQAAHA
jgi:sarcosine oxidase, subunit beta